MVTQIEPPAQESVHVVALTGIDQDALVAGRHDKDAVALPDIDPVDLEQALLLQLAPLDPADRVAAANLHPVARFLTEQRDMIAPEELLLPFSPGGWRCIEEKGRRIAGKELWLRHRGLLSTISTRRGALRMMRCVLSCIADRNKRTACNPFFRRVFRRA